MSVSVQIKSDAKEVERMFRNLNRGADKVLTRTLNKTIRSVFTVSKKTLAKDLRLKQKIVAKELKVYKANFRFKSASVVASGRRIPIIDFNAKKIKKGITYNKWGGGRSRIPGAFFATMSSGHKGVFKRTSKKRLPITELHGPSIPHVFLKKAVQNAMDTVAVSSWRKNLAHELSRFIKNA